MSVGLIVNPLSGKGNGKGLVLADLLKDTPGIDARLLTDFAALADSVEDFLDRGMETICISSGDGTIQAVQTLLAENAARDRLPRLCLLPHGTTNMTAGDLGLKIKAVKQQAAFIAGLAGGNIAARVRERPTLRIANAADGKVRHGMFAGTGAVWRATQFCQQAVHKAGLRGDFATAATLAVSLLQVVLGRRDRDDATRIDRAYEMRIVCDGKVVAEGGELLFLATTLETLILNTRPFWGGKTGPIRASVFDYPPPNIVRWIRTTLYGLEDRKMPEGCRSLCAHDIEIATDCPFVIDGEFFDPPVGEPLRIETGPEFAYVVG